MSQGVLDAELAKGLKRAKTRPQNFALVTKSSTPLALIVSGKPIKPEAILEVKKAVKGLDSIKGICQGEGGLSIVFRVVGLLPSVKNQQFKELLTEQTGTAYKPRFEVVMNLTEIDDNDSETSDDDVTSSTTPPDTSPLLDTTTTPPEVSTTPPTDGSQFAERLKEIKPDLDKARASGHSNSDTLKRLASEMAMFARKQNYVAAGELLAQVEQLVRQILGSASTSPPKQPRQTEDTGVVNEATKGEELRRREKEEARRREQGEEQEIDRQKRVEGQLQKGQEEWFEKFESL